ncbi:hypothetical protein V6N13_140944 [Hibiscus sabdariffa]
MKRSKHVELICAISLSKSGLRDEVVWRFDGSSSYSVKSRYRLLQMKSRANIGEAAAISPMLSRFFSEVRRLNVINRCPMCENESESIEHIMKDCSFVRELMHAQWINFADQSLASVSLGSALLIRRLSWLRLVQCGKVFACPMFWMEEAPPRTMLAAEKDRLALDIS